MENLELGKKVLSLEEVAKVAHHTQGVILSEEAVAKVQDSHAFLQSMIAENTPIYGINTGFGLLSQVRIPEKDLEKLQYNLLRSHACGLGSSLDDSTVRAMLLLRASTLALGHSGVSLKLVQQILAVLNAGIIPIVPEQGSVGASGDLAPLSHLALVLIGEGRARVPKISGNVEMSGAEALRLCHLQAIQLGPKEGLALINGTQFMTAIGCLNLIQAEHLCNVADVAGALSLEAIRGSASAFDPLIHSVRPHPGQIRVASNLCKLLLVEGKKSPLGQSHENCGKIQDPYSFRCIPQVHGASRDVLVFARQILEREINSVTDNPLIFPKANGPGENRILSGGNFHGQIIAIAMDTLAIAVAELASISEQRLQKLMNPSFSSLPPFLTLGGGLNSGFMNMQVAAASIVSENKTLCHPASVDSIPTSVDKEDHVSMGAWAARKARTVIANTRKVLTIEMMAGAQGLDLLRPLTSSPILEAIHAQIRSRVARLMGDRAFFEDFAAMDEFLTSEQLQVELQSYFGCP